MLRVVSWGRLYVAGIAIMDERGIRCASAGGEAAGHCWWFRHFATDRFQAEIANRNATNSQVGSASDSGGFGTSTNAVVTSSEDTTANVAITITGQLATSTETITLESYLVELMSKI